MHDDWRKRKEEGKEGIDIHPRVVPSNFSAVAEPLRGLVNPQNHYINILGQYRLICRTQSVCNKLTKNLGYMHCMLSDQVPYQGRI